MARPHIENYSFWRKSDDELRFIIRDAREAAEALKGSEVEGKYLDQMHDAGTVLRSRGRL